MALGTRLGFCEVILFGATGMVGAGVLLECVADARVESVVAIVRSSTGRSHPKLREILHADFFNYDHLRAEFASCDACFFCLGVTSVGLDEAAYTRLTYDLTTAAAARDGRHESGHDLLLCLRHRHRQHRAQPHDVGAGERADGERHTGAAVQGGIHVQAGFHPAGERRSLQDGVSASSRTTSSDRYRRS